MVFRLGIFYSPGTLFSCSFVFALFSPPNCELAFATDHILAPFLAQSPTPRLIAKVTDSNHSPTPEYHNTLSFLVVVTNLSRSGLEPYLSRGISSCRPGHFVPGSVTHGCASPSMPPSALITGIAGGCCFIAGAHSRMGGCW